MKRSTFLLFLLFAAFGLLGQLETARAAISWTGDIDPSDPTTWSIGTYGYVGKIAFGSLTVDSNSDLISRFGYIGYNPGVTGQVTLIGTNSTWTNSGNLYISFHEVLQPLVVDIGTDPFPTAKIGDRVIATDAFHDDADLLLGGTPSPGGLADLADQLLGRSTLSVLRGLGFGFCMGHGNTLLGSGGPLRSPELWLQP